MKNQEIYSRDPAKNKLENEGVARSAHDATASGLAVLRYELETFVCEGQYEKGLEQILHLYLKNLEHLQQPAVWVSGSFGSGKTHFLKMLRALWVDVAFADGGTARELAFLPGGICAQLQELSRLSLAGGGLHAASGTLGDAASGSVRLAILGIILKSVGLPASYQLARFVIWLISEGIYDDVCKRVEDAGSSLPAELDKFYVSARLHTALVSCRPDLFTSTSSCVATLNNLYPFVQDISNEEMIKTIRQALSKDGKLPFTMLALDELQQYIGDDAKRSMDVQEAIECCCKNLGSTFLLVGSGQDALNASPGLKRLSGRFTVNIQLSDSDVDKVVRKVVLKKKEEVAGRIEAVMESNLGEICRQLVGTSLAHRQSDSCHFVEDYPLLPARRRFFQAVVHSLEHGEGSQLRNQLSIIHKAVQSNASEELGCVIAGDYVFWQLADRLLHAGVLSAKSYERLDVWSKGSEKDRLVSRACGLVVLMNQLSRLNPQSGVRATIDNLVDLLLTDLAAGSSALRSKLPPLLDDCELLMKVGDEYRMHTEQSYAWHAEFQRRRTELNIEPHRIDAERDELLRQSLLTITRNFGLSQGGSKVPREVHLCFGKQLPSDCDRKIYVWVQDEWSAEEASVRADACKAGNDSPVILVFIGKVKADDLRRQLIDFKASVETLDRKGDPASPQDREARSAMETIRAGAESAVHELIAEALTVARVYQGGGRQISGASLEEKIQKAAQNALARLYPQFQLADHSGWQKACELARQGASAPLKAVAYEGEPGKNPICKQILSFAAGGKKGDEIFSHFAGPGFGWTPEAIEGALLVLSSSGLLAFRDEKEQSGELKSIDRKKFGRLTFKAQSAALTAKQRIAVRGLLQKIGCRFKPGEELIVVPEFIARVRDLGLKAGGEFHLPANSSPSILDEIERSSGDEQLLAIYEHYQELVECIEKFTILELPMAIFRTEADVDEWISELRQRISGAVKKGPVMIR